MKSQLALFTSFLLLWMQTAFVSCDDKGPKTNVVVTEAADGIKLTCGTGYTLKKKVDDESTAKSELPFKDEESGEFVCQGTDSNKEKIYIKFRTCDSCIELDTESIVGIVVGNVVATTVIGVAVYLIASVSHNRSAAAPKKKSSDRQHLVPNEGSSRATNDQYEALRPRQGQTYDLLRK